jgi:hypothetical protein
MTEHLIVCKRCGHTADKSEFRAGRGRHLGEHPDHRYCPACGQSITWYGYRTAKPTGQQKAA